VTRPAPYIAVGLLAAACAVTAACSGTTNSPAQPAATTAPAQATPAAPTAQPAAHVDPCALLTPAEGQAALHKPLGAGRKVSAGDLDECAYDSAGPLIVAVLRSPFTAESLKRLIASQNAGPYVKTTGLAVPLAGLGDAAYSIDKAGIVEVLKGQTVISVTSGSTATSKQVAQAVLPHLP
jgi:hypothetical protein